MEDNEIMNNVEDFEVEIIDEGECATGMSTGLAMLIGGGIATAVIVGGKKLKKLWDERKASRDSGSCVVIKAETLDHERED